MGQRNGLAPSDIIKLNKMYKCNGQRPSPAVSVNRPQPGQNNGGFGSFFNGIRPNWSSYPQQANSFISQLVSYFFRRNPRQNDAEYTPNPQSNGYGFSRSPNQYNSFDNKNYNYPNNNFNRQFNGGGGGYGFQGWTFRWTNSNDDFVVSWMMSWTTNTAKTDRIVNQLVLSRALLDAFFTLEFFFRKWRIKRFIIFKWKETNYTKLLFFFSSIFFSFYYSIVTCISYIFIAYNSSNNIMLIGSFDWCCVNNVLFVSSK